MRVILPSGVVIESTDDVEGEWLAKLVLNGIATKSTTPTTPKKSHHKKKAIPRLAEMESLSPELAQTWEWLVVHDGPDGIVVTNIADGLKITVNAATFRCNRLIEKGLAHRIRRGRYRPGEAPAETPELPETPAEVSAEMPVPASEVVTDSPE